MQVFVCVGQIPKMALDEIALSTKKNVKLKIIFRGALKIKMNHKRLP